MRALRCVPIPLQNGPRINVIRFRINRTSDFSDKTIIFLTERCLKVFRKIAFQIAQRYSVNEKEE